MCGIGGYFLEKIKFIERFMKAFTGNELFSVEKSFSQDLLEYNCVWFCFMQAELIRDFENWWMPKGFSCPVDP